MRYIILSALAFLISASAIISGPEDGPKRGYINNIDGEKCWYDQKVKEGDSYFYGSMTAVNGYIEFDDPGCMADNSTNIMMINNVISRWYSHDDANFQTRESELFGTSMLQEKGHCIQSETYPAIGILVDYFTEDGNITGLVHGMSIQGCKNEN